RGSDVESVVGRLLKSTAGLRFWRSSGGCRLRRVARRGTRKPNCLNVREQYRPMAERTTGGQAQLLAISARCGAEHGEATPLRPTAPGKRRPQRVRGASRQNP